MPKNLPPSTKIVGTAETKAGSQPFAFDTASGSLKLGHDRPDRTPSKPTADQLAALELTLKKELGVGLKQTRVGEYQCHDCNRWFDLMRDPNKWSYGMCFSCSMDRSSDHFG
jgi:hypothetical protein